MKRTVASTVPLLALTGLSLGLGATPASADVLPAPTTTLVGSLLPSASPLPLPLPTTSALPLPTASPLPLPLPTTSALPLPSSSPAPLPLPAPLPGGAAPAPQPGSGLLPTRTLGAPVHGSSVGSPTVDPAAAADPTTPVTAATSDGQLLSAGAPAWESALVGGTAFPSFPRTGAPQVAAPASMTVTRSADPSAPGTLPTALVAAAVASLVVAAGGQVLARTGRL